MDSESGGSSAGETDAEHSQEQEPGTSVHADTGGPDSVRFSVPEMDCPSCASTVEAPLHELDGIESVEARPTAGSVLLSYDKTQLSTTEIVDAIERAGYQVTDTRGSADSDSDHAGQDHAPTSDSVWRSERAMKTWISAVLTLLGLLLAYLLPALISGSNPELVALPTVADGIGGGIISLAALLFLTAVATSGTTILRHGYRSLRSRSLDIDLLMSIAIVGALVASAGFGADLYMEAALLAVLFNLAELLERYSVSKARDSLEALMELAPDEATVRRNGEELTVPVESVEVGDVVIVRPGERIPMDGIVREGESAVNQAPITGESVPVDKVPEDEVFAGTITESGYLEIEATATASDNTLSRIVDLVESAETHRTEQEQFVDRFASYYTPIVVVLAMVTALVPPVLIDGSLSVQIGGLVGHTFGGGRLEWFVNGLTLLVLACPCAFVISTPVSVVSGITSGARNGVLVKGGNHLEAMGDVEAIAMDKTGTLTRGELTVTDVIPLNGYSEEDVLSCARALESRSEHPIGEAIVEHAAGRSIETPTVEEFDSITGKGVRAHLHHDRHYAGKPALFDDLGFDLEHVHAATDGGVVTSKSRDLCERHDCLDLYEGVIPELQSEGKTVVLVGTEDELEGILAVADEVRPEARRTVQRLHDLGIQRIVMLTGDNGRTAGAIAAELGIDEYRAELLPDEKVEAIRELDETYDGVAMVGDGVNDAPALATATVGIAMGAAGTDTALETADIALLSDDLSGLPYLYRLSNRANNVIEQNIWGSLGLKALLALGVPFGLVTTWMAVLIGDAGMTLAITGNAMRLSRLLPEEWVDDGRRNAEK
jgi:Cd2+/Zn2+-exporting ATPase